MVLLSNLESYGKYHLGLAKTGLKSEVVLLSSGLNSRIALYVVLPRKKAMLICD